MAERRIPKYINPVIYMAFKKIFGNKMVMIDFIPKQAQAGPGVFFCFGGLLIIFAEKKTKLYYICNNKLDIL